MVRNCVNIRDFVMLRAMAIYLIVLLLFFLWSGALGIPGLLQSYPTIISYNSTIIPRQHRTNNNPSFNLSIFQPCHKSTLNQPKSTTTGSQHLLSVFLTQCHCTQSS